MYVYILYRERESPYMLYGNVEEKRQLKSEQMCKSQLSFASIDVCMCVFVCVDVVHIGMSAIA